MGPSPLRVTFAVCVLGALVCAASAAQAETSPRRPVLVSGSARVVQGLYTTSEHGALIELPNRAQLSVAPNTTLRVFPKPQLLALTPGPPTWTWCFSLQNGRVDVEMPKGRHAVLATLGKLSAAVTAGHSALRLNAGEATAANQEGSVRTLLNEHWQTVPVGWQATLSKDGTNVVPKLSLPGPALTSVQRLWFATGEGVAMRGFRWNAVPGATSYELRVRHLPDGKTVEVRGADKTELSEALTPVGGGRYSLAMRSVDAGGLEGSWTPETEVRVIGVVLPPGSYSAAQAIFLGPGQQVQFTQTDGVEMTYPGAGRYLPAAQGAGLYQNQSTVIGFRVAGALDTAIARLEPRALYADVHIGPAGAMWPRDPITIDIQLKSKTGGEITSLVRVVPTVRLGVDPLDLNFTQDGNSLHAVVPPSEKPGPWILRVDVADQYGVALGRDFLEISDQRRKNEVTLPMGSPPTPGTQSSKSAPGLRPAAEPHVAQSN